MKYISDKHRKAAIHKRLLLGGTIALTKPNFADMSQEDRLLRIALMCYLKHSGLAAADDIGWNELHDDAHSEICNTIGDDAFVKWGERMGGAEVEA